MNYFLFSEIKKKYIRFINTFSNDNYLKYDNLVIDSKYRIVETGGK